MKLTEGDTSKPRRSQHKEGDEQTVAWIFRQGRSLWLLGVLAAVKSGGCKPAISVGWARNGTPAITNLFLQIKQSRRARKHAAGAWPHRREVGCFPTAALPPAVHHFSQVQGSARDAVCLQAGEDSRQGNVRSPWRSATPVPHDMSSLWHSKLAMHSPMNEQKSLDVPPCQRSAPGNRRS